MASKIILKDNGINNQPDTPSGYKYLGYDGDDLSQKSGATVSSLGGALPYKIYTVLLNQSGTSAPVATILQNTLSGTPVWTRTGAGSYTCTLASEFTINKTVIFTGQNYNNIGLECTYAYPYGDGDAVGIETIDGTNLSSPPSSDDTLIDTFVEIRVYP